MIVVPIVEGDGEVSAVPVLLRRMTYMAAASHQVQIGRPIRKPRNQLLKREGFSSALALARINGADAVLYLIDSDGECPVRISEKLIDWADDEASDLPCHIVLAHQEYESWFLASIPSLRQHSAMVDNAEIHPDPELRQGAKEQLTRRMHPGTSYSPTAHQAAFSDTFDMAAAYAHCRSFRKLTKAFGEILLLGGVSLAEWPPQDWGHKESRR